MRKFYECPEITLVEVCLGDCLAVSQSDLPENPIPDIEVPGDDFNFDF